MDERIRTLRDAVIGRNRRQVEVTPDGEVREVRREEPARADAQPEVRKPTKLAPRTFGL